MTTIKKSAILPIGAEYACKEYSSQITQMKNLHTSCVQSFRPNRQKLAHDWDLHPSLNLSADGSSAACILPSTYGLVAQAKTWLQQH
jgi:hypothetical protein